MVIRWSDRGRSLHITKSVHAGDTIWIEKPLVSVPHNAKKSVSACHFCGKVENDVQLAEPNISTVPDHIMEMLQKIEKLKTSTLSGDQLEHWKKIAEEEQKNPQKDPNFLSEVGRDVRDVFIMSSLISV